MFILVGLVICTLYVANVHKTKIADLIQISPEDFQKPSAESIEDNINAKYANRVGRLFLNCCLARGLSFSPLQVDGHLQATF